MEGVRNLKIKKGMKVVVIKDKSENVVKKMVWYNVGEEDEE